MKQSLALLLLFLVVHGPAMLGAAPAPATPAAPAAPAKRAAEWKAVDEAVSKGLPRTAITNLAPIIAGALRDKAYGEAAKAMARRIVLEANIEGNKPEEKITRLEAEIARAPREVAPLLETLQATWYWHYFQQNRWRFLRRSATAAPPGADFTTWDLPRLFAEIDARFTKALASAAVLQRTPVTVFDDLLNKGNTPDAWRPTLYDFVAHEALKFYSSGEQAAAKPEDAFEVSADSPVFGGVDEFLAWQPATTDTAAPKLKAIRLYQDLLRFHRRDADPAALLLADIERVQFGQNVAFGENANTRAKAAYQAIATAHGDHELGGYANYRRARVLQQEGDLAAARTLALSVRGAFRDTFAGRKAHNLIEEIETPSASIQTERVWNAPWPGIQVRYRNVTNVWFRAVAWDWAEFLEKRHSRPEYLNDQERKALLAKAPALAWSAPLPPTADFKERVEALTAPGSLKPGFYFLVASHQADFGEKENQVSYTDFWVSDLALVVRPRAGKVEGFVLEAGSGEPVAGAVLNAWHLDNQGNRVAAPEARTDELGFFTLEGKGPQRGRLIRVRHNGRELASQQEYWTPERGAVPARLQTVLFTDRALYRPGQTIQYKGIALRVDPDKDNYEVLAGRLVKIQFLDPNGKEVAKAEHRCNDYGSFSGSVTAPRDRLMGHYTLRITSGEHGQAGFNVEEYKRPKFLVKLEAPRIAAKLNERVAVPGRAEAYTGAAVGGAQVKWRVVREVRWPDWWGWFRPSGMPRGESQEIAHGTAATGPDGLFTVEFIARPDPKVSDQDEASFSYTVHADVTDTTGETRSDQRAVNVGFVALRARLSAGDWQTEGRPVEVSITTTTLDGEGQLAEGSVKIHRLKAPERVQRPPLGFQPGPRWRGGDNASPGPGKPDLSNPDQWELADVAAEKGFTTDAQGKATLSFTLPPGLYRAMLQSQDRFGRKVTAPLPLRVLQPDAPTLGLKVPQVVAAPAWSRQPGQAFTAIWGTGYDEGRAFIEIEHRDRMVQRFWTLPGRTQAQLEQAVDESMRGGFTLHVTQVRENRAHLVSRRIEVPWSNKELELKWERFTSKLGPAQKETWTASITGPGATKAAAELVATLYDESLDAFQKQQWLQRFSFFRQDFSTATPDFVNDAKGLQHILGQWTRNLVASDMSYRSFPSDLVENFWGYGAIQYRMRGGMPMMVADGMPAPTMAMEGAVALAAAPAPEARLAKAARAAGPAAAAGLEESAPPAGAAAPKSPDLSQVSARKNLNETAFFFPQLVSGADGIVRLEFTMPEALTQWRFLGFAHDAQCRSGFLEAHTVTAKDLMVQPNPPRFLREGDTVEFTVKVSNQSAARQQGTAKLTLADARTGQSADALLGLAGVTAQPARRGAPAVLELPFDIPAKESRTLAWRLTVPDGAPFLTYKAVGSTGRLSDGEEGYLPVLARRVLVTESLPLPIRGQAGGPVTKRFEFEKLLKSGRSSSLVHQNLTVQMVSNPSWYAVMALPYLMEFPYECSEQIFNRLYANALARSIANSDPKIRRVFDQWKGTPALDSPLEKNQDLKAVLLEETPWLRQAQAESQARRNVGILFDDNRLNDETARTLAKLTEMQLPDGAWPWFPGGRGNDYITLYVTTGFGRLRHLGVDVSTVPALKSLARLDGWMTEHYQQILKWKNPGDYVPSSTDALYLYGRSFFLKDRPIAAPHQEAIAFFLKQARAHWLKVGDRQSQGHLAIALHRWGGDDNRATARAILRSIKERSVSNEEMGMFWRETELSWWWYRAPIETQALMIEAFDEVVGDKVAVEECRVWLLKQKQTQDWKTTKATADAIYALLLRGRDVLASDALVEVKLGGLDITPGARGASGPRGAPTTAPEAGTGFYEKRFAAGDIQPKLGDITVRKVDEGVAWGSIHWQYLEDLGKVTAHTATPLKLAKSLYTRAHTKKGPVLQAVKGPVQVGDELVVRIVLRVDRDMEYVHLKDQRGSGTEPVNVLSGYRFQDGLAYYESTRDTASHFFIDYLPKGTYVFEYSTRVQLRGAYQTGVASIQCMYAPEFNSHSESIPLSVR
ncbi:MAG: hypothetical protein RJA22_2914 [Verrucomicrobiota bacterium]